MLFLQTFLPLLKIRGRDSNHQKFQIDRPLRKSYLVLKSKGPHCLQPAQMKKKPQLKMEGALQDIVVCRLIMNLSGTKVPSTIETGRYRLFLAIRSLIFHCITIESSLKFQLTKITIFSNLQLLNFMQTIVSKKALMSLSQIVWLQTI